MKYCDKCHLNILDAEEFCPLCNSVLTDTGKEKEVTFPYVPTVYQKYSKFFKILYFICTSASILSVLINILLVPKSYFSIFVLLGVICFLLILKIAIANRKNMPKTIFIYVLVLSLLSIVWDVATGNIGWSFSFAIPIICLMGSIDMAIIVIVMNIYISEYIIYYLVVGLLGLVPLVFLFLHLVSVRLPSMICVFFNTLVLLGMFFLQKDLVLTEIKRRFHI